ncbi:MAG TPA: cytochrome c oxidase subunit 4 [Candidatus Obscuribacterales bacterium]
MAEQHADNAASGNKAGMPLPERIPPPTVWPVTLALGITLLCFGIVTSWVMSAAGLIFFVLGVVGWFEDLRKDVQQS